jgi:hypothetical protein
MTAKEFAEHVRAYLEGMIPEEITTLVLPVTEVGGWGVVVLNPDPRRRADGGLGIHKTLSARWFSTFLPREGAMAIAGDMAMDVHYSVAGVRGRPGYSLPSIAKQVEEYLAKAKGKKIGGLNRV